MTTAGTIDRTLQIDGMTGEDCVQKVKAALRDVPGVSTRSVKVGSATIGCDQPACDAGCEAIERAGYEAHEQSSNGKAGDAAGCTGKSKGGESMNNTRPAGSPSAAAGATTPSRSPTPDQARDNSRNANQGANPRPSDQAGSNSPAQGARKDTPASNAQASPKDGGDEDTNDARVADDNVAVQTQLKATPGKASSPRP